MSSKPKGSDTSIDGKVRADTDTRTNSDGRVKLPKSWDSEHFGDEVTLTLHVGDDGVAVTIVPSNQDTDQSQD